MVNPSEGDDPDCSGPHRIRKSVFHNCSLVCVCSKKPIAINRQPTDAISCVLQVVCCNPLRLICSPLCGNFNDRYEIEEADLVVLMLVIDASKPAPSRCTLNLIPQGSLWTLPARIPKGRCAHGVTKLNRSYVSHWSLFHSRWWWAWMNVVADLCDGQSWYQGQGYQKWEFHLLKYYYINT